VVTIEGYQSSYFYANEILKPVQKVLFGKIQAPGEAEQLLQGENSIQEVANPAQPQCEIQTKGGSRLEPVLEEIEQTTPGILVTNAAQLAKSQSHNTSTLSPSSKQSHPPGY